MNPYLAFETIHDQIRLGMLKGPADAAEKKYVKAVNKGIVKVISKMGISTIQSYHGAQVFEAIGLNQDFIDEYFTWTPTRIGGVGIDVVGEGGQARGRSAPSRPSGPIVHKQLGTGGQYQYRQDGEQHLFNPLTIHKLQYACRSGELRAVQGVHEARRRDGDAACARCAASWSFVPAARPVPIEEVEPVEAIVRRFKTGAMSYGSISQGGARGARHRHEPPGRQVQHRRGRRGSGALQAAARTATRRTAPSSRWRAGRFGVTSHYLVNARELQIKMAQGAKPGEGGQLPGSKVYPWIAKTRHATPGVGLISPPPHHDIYSIEDLAQLIHDLKNANHAARVSVKLVAEVGVGTIAAGRRQGARRRGAHRRPRRRHRRLAAHLHQARRHALGARAWPRRTRCSS